MDFSDGPPSGRGGGLLRADPVPAQAAAVAAVKAYLRIDGDQEDALLARLVPAAIAHGERFLGQALIVRTMRQVLPVVYNDWRRLGIGPVAAITLIEAVADDESLLTLAPSGYALDIDASGDGWVRAIEIPAARMKVTFSAGLADDWSALPESIGQGVVRLAAHLFTHRDDAAEAAPPAAIAALWRPWRRLSLGIGL
jgi:uncharacterized phiE125 gp8 family phage protein